jgi:hypothetical protein
MELISRIHINGKNLSNEWEQLSSYLKEDLKPLEETKAVFTPKNNIAIIKRKLDKYNEKYDTDFSIEFKSLPDQTPAYS